MFAALNQYKRIMHSIVRYTIAALLLPAAAMAQKKPLCMYDLFVNKKCSYQLNVKPLIDKYIM